MDTGLSTSSKRKGVDKVTPPALSTTGLTPPPEKRRRESPDLGTMDQTMTLGLTQSTDSVNAAVEEEVSLKQTNPPSPPRATKERKINENQPVHGLID